MLLRARYHSVFKNHFIIRKSANFWEMINYHCQLCVVKKPSCTKMKTVFFYFGEPYLFWLLAVHYLLLYHWTGTAWISTKNWKNQGFLKLLAGDISCVLFWQCLPEFQPTSHQRNAACRCHVWQKSSPSRDFDRIFWKCWDFEKKNRYAGRFQTFQTQTNSSQWLKVFFILSLTILKVSAPFLQPASELITTEAWQLSVLNG